MSAARFYTTQLQAGLGLIEETRLLLGLYEPGMSTSELSDKALASGLFPLVSARRLHNIVSECFAPRYLRTLGTAAALKLLASSLTRQEFSQLLFLHTARANLILDEFVREQYWPHYSAGRDSLSNYWPQRVREKCVTDKSLAIAHGLEQLYVEPEVQLKKARGKKKSEGGV